MRSRRPPASSRHPAILRPRAASERSTARPARASVSARRGRRVPPDRAGSPVTVPAEHYRPGGFHTRDSRALEPDHPAKELLQPNGGSPSRSGRRRPGTLPSTRRGNPHGRHCCDAELPAMADEQQVVSFKVGSLAPVARAMAHGSKKAILFMCRTHQFLEDALMHRFGTLIMVLTLASRRSRSPLKARPTWRDVCKVLGDAKPVSGRRSRHRQLGGGKVAAWRSWDRSGRATRRCTGSSELRRQGPGKSGVVQILTGSLASGLESPRALVFRWALSGDADLR